MIDTCKDLNQAFLDIDRLKYLDNQERITNKFDKQRIRLLEISLESVVSKYKPYSLESETLLTKEKYLSERIKKWIKILINFIKNLLTKMSNFIIRLKNNRIIYKEQHIRKLDSWINDVKKRKGELDSIKIPEDKFVAISYGKKDEYDHPEFSKRMIDSIKKYISTDRIGAIKDLSDKIKNGQFDLDYHDKRKLSKITIDKWVSESKKSFIEKLIENYNGFEAISLMPGNNLIIYSDKLGDNQVIEPGYKIIRRQSNIISGEGLFRGKKISQAINEANVLIELIKNADRLKDAITSINSTIEYIGKNISKLEKAEIKDDSKNPEVIMKLLMYYVSNQISLIVNFNNIMERYISNYTNVLFLQADIRYNRV